jgi:hypothetical protein
VYCAAGPGYYDIKMANNFFKNVTNLGTVVTSQHFITEGIKSRLNCGICFCSECFVFVSAI